MAWLGRYGGDYHEWKTSTRGGETVFYRPLGIVESAFDADGQYFGGRADISMNAHFDIKTTLAKDDLRERILLAWTCLRLRHTLLLASATTARSYMDSKMAARSDRFFHIRRPDSAIKVIQESREHMVFMDDHHHSVDPLNFYHHSQNTARILRGDECLSKIFVHPLSAAEHRIHHLNFTLILAHQISDGLTNSTWMKTFLRLLNTPRQDLEAAIPGLVDTISSRLPSPQESLYPPITGSKARQRWFWAITLALRHTHRPNPRSFPNPLRRGTPLPATLPETRPFASVLPYTKPPVLNAGNVSATLHPSSVRRLHRLCRTSHTSIGAGTFVLVALVMMRIYEERSPDVPLDKRLPFAGSFPINPRAFFNHEAQPNSCMLAFSDGVVLPFLSSDLDLDGRIRLLVRSAQRQLSRYQKRGGGRVRENEMSRSEAVRYWGSSGAGRIVALNYIDAIERVDVKLPQHMRKGFPPGEVLPRKPGSMATCGVTSVGRGDPGLAPGQYDLTKPLGEGNDMAVDIRGLKMGVRPRDGEFLVGVGGTDDSFGANVSYDASAIDETWVSRWKELMETILEEDGGRAKL